MRKVSIIRVLIIIFYLLGIISGPLSPTILHSSGNENPVIVNARATKQYISNMLDKYGYIESSICGHNIWLVSIKENAPESMANLSDSDGDGLYDIEERSLGTDPSSLDTDGDCIPDGVEAGYALMFYADQLKVLGEGETVVVIYRNVGNPAASSIYYPVREGDATHYWYEHPYLTGMTNPTKNDTDGDGLSDLHELSTLLRTYRLIAWPAYVIAGDPTYVSYSVGEYAYYEGYMDYNVSLYNPFSTCLPSEVEAGENLLGLQCAGPMSSEGSLVWYAVPQEVAGLEAHGYTFTQMLNNIHLNPASRDTDGDGLDDYAELAYHSSPSLPDTDGDGLPDISEIFMYGTSPSSPDSDGDILTDYDEVMKFHTSPASADTDGDGWDDWYELRRSNTSPLLADTDNDMIRDSEDPYPLASDWDGDGLVDGVESPIYGTSPFMADSDYDGLSDGYEVHHFTDPTRYDTDGDGLNDSEEINVTGTSPSLWDTDGDGLGDGVEQAYGTSPLAPDTDGDGLSDYEEVNGAPSSCTIYDYASHQYVELSTAYRSNATSPDTDHDGITDLQEALNCTNPATGDTDGDGLSDHEDPYPWKADADGDGLTDYEELQRGTSPFDPDTDHDGIPDPQDPVPDQPPQPPEEPPMGESHRPVYHLLPLGGDGLACHATTAHQIVCEGNSSSLSDGSRFTVRFKYWVTYGNKTYNASRVIEASPLLPKYASVEGSVSSPPLVVINYTVKKLVSSPGDVLTDYIDVTVRLKDREGYYADKNVEVVLKISDRRGPRIHVNGSWLKYDGNYAKEGLLVVSCDVCSTVKIMSPGLLISGSSQKIVRTWQVEGSHSIVVWLKPVPPVAAQSNISNAVTVPDLPIYGAGEKGALPMAKALGDTVKSGQEIGYYIAQITIAKSSGAKIIYGVLAAYDLADSIIGGLRLASPVEAAENAGEEAAESNPYVQAALDFIKEHTVDAAKTYLDNLAKQVEEAQTAHVTSYHITVEACNSFGCTTTSIDLEGIGYGS